MSLVAIDFLPREEKVDIIDSFLSFFDTVTVDNPFKKYTNFQSLTIHKRLIAFFLRYWTGTIVF